MGLIALDCVLAVVLSESVIVSVQTVQLLHVDLYLLLYSWRVPGHGALSWHGLVPLTRVAFVLTFLYWGFLNLSTLQVFALIEVTDVLLQELHEKALLPVHVQVCWYCLSKVALNRGNSFLAIFVGQRLRHFAPGILFFILSYSSVGGRNKLSLGEEVHRRIEILDYFFRQNKVNWLSLLTPSFCFFEVGFLLGDLLLAAILLIQFISLRDLFILLLVYLGAILLRTPRPLVFRTILLELELFFDVVQILLIHLGEKIIRLLVIRPQELRGDAFRLDLRTLTDL